jgi:sec-independent protein translocase protein TatA
MQVFQVSNSRYGLGRTSSLHFVAHFQGRRADKVGDEATLRRAHRNRTRLELYSVCEGAYANMLLVFIRMNVMFAAVLGGWEIVLILAVVLILFGAKKLPELAKGLGTGIKEFKKATREVTDEIHNAMEDTTPARRLPPTPTVTEVQPQPQPEQQTVPQSSPSPKA